MNEEINFNMIPVGPLSPELEEIAKLIQKDLEKRLPPSKLRDKNIVIVEDTKTSKRKGKEKR